jgi:hypothetical protein
MWHEGHLGDVQSILPKVASRDSTIRVRDPGSENVKWNFLRYEKGDRMGSAVSTPGNMGEDDRHVWGKNQGGKYEPDCPSGMKTPQR